jgi:DNA-binding transcriptional LysR family regulator
MPAELLRHDVLAFGFADHDIVWEMTRAGDTEAITVNPRAQVSDMVALRRLLLRHGGIAQLPDYLCRADLAAGRLERVLRSWNARDSVATLLLPARRGVAPGARALADFIAAELPLALAKVGTEADPFG